MKKVLAAALLFLLSASQVCAGPLTRKERWIMRVAGMGLVGLGFFARSNESDYNQKADNAMSDFAASHSSRQGAGSPNDQFGALALQSSDERSANAWNLGKNASWGTAGLLFTISIIPNTWIKPVDNGNGVMVGYEVKFPLPKSRK